MEIIKNMGLSDAFRPSYNFLNRAYTKIMLLLVTLLIFSALTGCDIQRSSAPIAPSPTNTLVPITTGQQVIERSQTAHLLDATFTLSWIINSTSTFVKNVPPIFGSGNGKLTTHPRRDEIFDQQSISGETSVYEEETIDDYATQTAYLWDGFPGEQPNSNWIKTEDNARMFSPPGAALIYLHLKAATLVGAEQVNGTEVWHVRGTLVDRFNTGVIYETGVIDAYLRQDTYLPFKMQIHVTSPDTSEDYTYLYTALNSGISISLPRANEIIVPTS
jgi:hypothetical protein